jgi:16S rRNA (uracil1498-N3)-methyltransferase
LITKHADVRLRDEQDGARRRTRWQRIALEAAKQSGRARVPVIATPSHFTTLIESSNEKRAWRLMFTEREGSGLLSAVEKTDTRVEAATALVGPEGGWADEEIAQARDAGWRLVTLGGRTLRAETAAITITALLQHLFGDLR